MSQPLRVAAFEVIISGRFWVITKASGEESAPEEIEEESSLAVCEFLEANAFTQQIVRAFQTGSCKNYPLA